LLVFGPPNDSKHWQRAAQHEHGGNPANHAAERGQQHPDRNHGQAVERLDSSERHTNTCSKRDD
jgi:hypothetical protein